MSVVISALTSPAAAAADDHCATVDMSRDQSHGKCPLPLASHFRVTINKQHRVGDRSQFIDVSPVSEQQQIRAESTTRRRTVEDAFTIG